MRAMILAAGRGQRMGHLTNDVPKPLLTLNGKFLIEYSIEGLAAIGVKDIVINLRYCREQIKAKLGDGSKYGVHFHYSEEHEMLETGGGIIQALPLLSEGPFIVLSSDVISHYPLKNLLIPSDKLAHIVLVDNPDFHPTGDFHLDGNQLCLTGPQKLTFSNIGIYRPELFTGYERGPLRLGDVLKQAILADQISGEHYQGLWYNLTKPEHIVNAELDKRLVLHF